MVQRRELKQLTMRVFQKFLQGDPIELLVHLHPMALWDAPSCYECLWGKEEIVKALQDSGKIQRRKILVNGRGIKAIPGLFWVMAECVDGELEPSVHSAIPVSGHIMVLWVREAKEQLWRILEVHQNLHIEKEHNCFYLKLQDTNRVWHWIASSDILYIEARKSHCCLVTSAQAIEVLQTITELTRQSKGILLRVHRSYLVNPNQVIAVHRFQAVLSNGTKIPIPEKKYTAMKQALLPRL